MRLENIVALTNATLLNEPFVSEYANIVFDIAKLKRGDLFVAFDTSKVDEAIANGAYAILFDKPLQISDQEIAWIKVKDLQEALLRLLRFRLVEKEVVAYECDAITIELAMGVETYGKSFVIFDEIIDCFQALWEIEPKTPLLFYPKKTIKELFTNIKKLPNFQKEHITVIEKTLYETSFIFADTYYERVLLSPFFLPYLEKLLGLYEGLKIPYRLKSFENLTHFQICFSNKNLTIKEYGSSELVLIFEKDFSFLQEEFQFLQHNAPWAKLLFLVPVEKKAMFNFSAMKVYHSKEELFSILYQEQYHIALIGGVESTILENRESKQQPTQLTFDF